MTTTDKAAPDAPNIACADALMAIFGLYRVGAEPALDGHAPARPDEGGAASKAAGEVGP